MKRTEFSGRMAAVLGSWMVRGTVVVAVAGAGMLLGVRSASSEPAASAPAKELAVQGTCTFSGKNSTWSAKLTPKGENTYEADYDATWGGRPLKFKGTIKTDWKGEIAGEGKGSSGTFQFAGKFGNDGVAKCPYNEVGGRGRNGSLTVTAPAK